MIPPEVSLDDVSESIVDGPFGSNLKTSDYVESGVPVLQGKNITGDRFIWKDVRYITEDKAKELGRSSVRVGDHLVVKIGSIGYSAIVDSLNGHQTAIIPANLARIRPNPRLIHGRYLHHWLISDEAKRYFVSVASKTAQPALSLTKIREAKLPLPPLAEQRRIAAILDKADELYRKRKRALGLLDSLTQSIFLEMFGDPISNPHGLHVSTVDPLLETPPNFGSMIPPQKEVLGWLSLRVANIQNWALTLDDAKYIDLPAESQERHSLRDDDIVLARAIASEEHLGKCVVVRPGLRRWAFDSHLMRIRLNRRMIEPVYVRELFRTPGGRQIFLRSTRKTTVQYNINTKELRALRIPVPPIDLQRDFVARVSELEAIQRVEESSQELTGQFLSSLQHRAFSGQL